MGKLRPRPAVSTPTPPGRLSPEPLPITSGRQQLREPRLCGEGWGQGGPGQSSVGLLPQGPEWVHFLYELLVDSLLRSDPLAHVLGTVHHPERKAATVMRHETLMSIALLEKLGTGWHLLEKASPTLSETVSSWVTPQAPSKSAA